MRAWHGDTHVLMCVLRDQVISTYRKHMIEKNASELHRLHLVLVEGEGKKSKPENVTLTGRTDGNKRCVFSACSTPVSSCVNIDKDAEGGCHEGAVTLQDIIRPFLQQVPHVVEGSEGREEDVESRSESSSGVTLSTNHRGVQKRVPQEGDYAVVRITEAKGQVLYGVPIAITTLQSFHRLIGSSL